MLLSLVEPPFTALAAPLNPGPLLTNSLDRTGTGTSNGTSSLHYCRLQYGRTDDV
jgi:hypothetical protein